MRLVTRSDFDGLVCAALLEEIGAIDSYLFVHPKDVQDGTVQVTSNDILANVPYAPGCGYWFDHHASEAERLAMEEQQIPYQGVSCQAPSCARLIYEYYGGAEVFSGLKDSGLMDAVDRSDSGNLTEEEVLHPTGWILLSFVMDSRTGLGRYHDYRISNHALMRDMIGYVRSMTVDQILALPDVQERVDRYWTQEKDYMAMIRGNSRVEDNVLVIDLREVPEILSGNRFVEYAIYPWTNVSVRVIWGRERKNVVLTVGHSILNRSCRANVGSLMLHYGGGGHHQVGTCQVDAAVADQVLTDIVEYLKKMG